MKTVSVIDYGMSNLHSVSKALEHIAGNDWQVQVSAQPEVILKADKVVFPGQGAIGNCMELLNQTGLSEVIKHALRTKPFLGICLGLQTLLTQSEESGGTTGFNWITGQVRRFEAPLLDPATGERLKIPHMGWNQVHFTDSPHPFWRSVADNSRFYFVHSYYVVPADNSVIAATTPYGGIDFTSAVIRDNVVAVQFHPEKSQRVGLTLLKNFLAW